MVELEVVRIKNPETNEIILGQGNFSVKTVDDLYTLLVSSVPDIKVGVAMNESKPQLTRVNGNDERLIELSSETAREIGAGHVFVIYMSGAFPVNVLNEIKNHPCVCCIYAATSNPLEVIVATTEMGRSVLGVVDGLKATMIENEEQKKERRELVKSLGFLPK